MATPNVETVARNPDIVGENPLWNPDDRRLYWTDNRSQRVLRLDPATGAVETVVEGHSFYAFTFQTDGLAAAVHGSHESGDGAGGRSRPPPHRRTAGGRGGPASTMSSLTGSAVWWRAFVPPEGGTGSLHSLGLAGSAILLATDLEMPNGMAFSSDDRLLYVAETRGRRISLFDYDLDSGGVSNRRAFIDLSGEEGGSPDGITLDAEACLWVALSGGWSVVRYDPTGAEIARVKFPARKITSIGFGGR